jgi:hypothetical protein
MQVMQLGYRDWEAVAAEMPGRTARQCRERWGNYLSPTVSNGPWTEGDDLLLISKINEFGRSWSVLTRFFKGRSENDLKNRWHSHLKYMTVSEGRNLVLVSGDSACGRKKRNRTKTCPKQNALKLLEQIPRAPQTWMSSFEQKKYLPQPIIGAPCCSEMVDGDLDDMMNFWVSRMPDDLQLVWFDGVECEI